MTDEQFIQLIEGAFTDGLDVWHVRRVIEAEHLCDDGTGASISREDGTGPVERSTAEAIHSTGAWTNLTGTCVIDLPEDENRQIAATVETCELEIGSNE